MITWPAGTHRDYWPCSARNILVLPYICAKSLKKMIVRKATRNDLPAIIKMLTEDVLGATRETYADPLPESYYKAFDIIDRDPAQELIVVEDEGGDIIGTLQLTHIQYLLYKGGLRTLVEGVHIRKDQRGKKIGEKLLTWAINRAKEKGAHIVQLTSDNRRADAIRFYERLGFKDSHAGMKLHL